MEAERSASFPFMNNEKIKELSLDLETFSDVDIGKTGAYRYAESPLFEILLCGVSVNGGLVRTYDLASGEQMPEEILKAIVSKNVTKWAFNANFERVCLSTWIRKNRPDLFVGYGDQNDTTGNYLDPVSWKCSMVWSSYMGLPMSLKGVGAVLGLEEQKMTEGKDLIRYFCMPCKPTKKNGGRARNLPADAPDKWATFKRYNIRDVEVEMSIKDRLKNYPVPDSIWWEYHFDQRINDRGCLIDDKLVKNAIGLDAKVKSELSSRMKELTGLENPNSVQQLSKWLKDHGANLPSLGKKDVQEALKTAKDPVKEVLQLRLMLSKSSVKKYQAMLTSACQDHRCRGMFAFAGTKTLRWAGRIVQLQNLPQNHMSSLAEARALLRNGDFESMEMLYDDIPDTLSQLIRTAFIPKPGYLFYVADFSSIECRVLAWLAGEQWVLDAFAAGKDIYCEMASRMYGVKVEKHGQHSELRQKGKRAILGCGYGGGKGALVKMGALEDGIEEDELQSIVDMYRDSNPHIVKYWHAIDSAVKTTVKHGIDTRVGLVTFSLDSGYLFIHLPSGRHICYIQPEICINRFGSKSVSYMGLDSTRHWSRVESYGARFVENIVQATARDVLCNSFRILSGRYICMHIHDEMVIECTPDTPLKEICDLMGQTPSWAPGLILRADGYVTPWYKKD